MERGVETMAGGDFFTFANDLGFNERHGASRIAFVFEVRGAGFIVLKR